MHKLNYDNIKVKLLFLLFFMFYNQALFGYLFYSTPLYYWKQLVGVFLIPIVLTSIIKDKRSMVDNLSIFYFIFFVFSIFQITLLAGNPIFALYRAIGIILFLAVFSLVRSLPLNNKLYLAGKIKLICYFVIIGMFFDYQFHFSAYLANIDASLTSDDIFDRISFFTGSSTNLFIFLAVPLLFFRKKTEFFFYAATSCAAIYLSGSRLSLLFQVVLVFVVLIGLNKKYLFLLCPILIMFLFYLPTLAEFNDSTSRIFNMFSAEDAGNVGRFKHYSWFFKSFFDFPARTIFFGEGLGYLSSPENTYVSKHFESSLISSIIETGLIGFIFYYISFYAFIIYFSKSIIRYWFLMLFVQSLVVPSFPGYTMMMIIGFVFAFFREKDLISLKEAKTNSDFMIIH